MSVESRKSELCPGNGCERVITVYSSKGCLPCRQLVPSIVEQGETAGFRVEVIDVYSEDPEDRVRSRHVRWVPHIEYQGRELTVPQYEELIGRKVNQRGV
jgi:hypothetical protein